MGQAHLHLPLAAASAAHPFSIAVLCLGGLLWIGALLSGVARRSLLSLAALFVVAGLLLGPGALDVLRLDAHSGFVADLASAALIVILFRDGLEVEAEMLQRHWRLPLRKLVLAMPLTAVIVALAARVLTDLSLTQCFLLGALLSPTDPVLSSSVVTNPRVPAVVRHSLNLESGLNDGLALPAVLAFAAALSPSVHGFLWWRFVLENVSIGVGAGLLVGVIAAALAPRPSGRANPIHGPQLSLYALGAALAAYGTAALITPGNGLLAVYVGAITLGIRCPELRRDFIEHAEALVELVKVGIFVVFGSLLSFPGLFTDGWAAAALAGVTLLVARPVAVFAALVRTPTDLATRGFMAWFGPKGVATMTFSLLVLSQGVRAGQRIFDLAALVVFCSVIAHGLTDTPGAEWLGRRAEPPPQAAISGDRGPRRRHGP